MLILSLDHFLMVSVDLPTLPICKIEYSLLYSILIMFYSHFRNNTLSGSIPTAWANMSSIQGIYLSNNNLSGPFPTVVTQIKSLQNL